MICFQFTDYDISILIIFTEVEMFSVMIENLVYRRVSRIGVK
jgi:hypothetical protein